MAKYPGDELVLIEEDQDAKVPTKNEGLRTELVRIVNDLIEDLFRIDVVLAQCRDLLVLMQPARPGRIDLRFWKHKTIAGKHPGMCRWQRLRPGLQPAQHGLKQRRMVRGEDPQAWKWTAEKLPRTGLKRLAKRSGAYQPTHRFAVMLLERIEELLAHRAALTGRVGTLRFYENRWAGRKRDRVEAIGAYVTANTPGLHRVAKVVAEEHKREAEIGRRLVEQANRERAARQYRVIDDPDDIARIIGRVDPESALNADRGE
jgi:hypothetical protein